MAAIWNNVFTSLIVESIYIDLDRCIITPLLESLSILILTQSSWTLSRELFLYFLNRHTLSLLQVSSLAVCPWFCSEVRGCFWVSERTWAHPAGRGSRKLSLPSSAALWLTIDKARWRSFIQTLHETIVRSGFSHKWIYLRHWVCDCERSLNEARRIRLAWSDLLLF